MLTDDRTEALSIQKKFYGKPQGLAQYLVEICLNKINIVTEVFYVLDNFSTLDVGYRFVDIIPNATLNQLVKKRRGKAFCEILLSWLLTVKPSNNAEKVAPGVDSVIQLMKLRTAIKNAPPADENEENPYYTIDKGIVLETDAIAVLDKIAPLYFKGVGKKFNVNS